MTTTTRPGGRDPSGHDELIEAAERRLLEAALAEVVGGDLARRRPDALSHTRRWFAAALVLLGCGVITAVVLASKDAGGDAAATQDPAPLPAAVQVDDPARLVELDRSTQHLKLSVSAPDDLLPLREFAALRRLELVSVGAARFDAAAWAAAGDAALAPLRGCVALRSLTLGYLPQLSPRALQVTSELPALVDLELTGVSHLVDAALVADLGELRLQRLALNAVRIAPAGFARLGELPLLEELVLRDCLHLDRCELPQLGRLRRLQRLVLRGVGGDLAQALGGSNPLPGDPTPAPQPLRMLTDVTGDVRLLLDVATMRAIAGLPALRALSLRGSVVDDAVMAALPRRLEQLELNGVIGLTPRGVAVVRAMPELVVLGCSNHPVEPPPRGTEAADPAAVDRALREVVRARPLAELQLQGSMTPPWAAAIAAQPALRAVHLVGAGDKTADLRSLPALPQLELLTLTNVPEFDPEPLARCEALRRVELCFVPAEAIAAVRAAVRAGVTVAEVEASSWSDRQRRRWRRRR